MDPITSSYALIQNTEIDGNSNIADLWSTNNESYINHITNHNNSVNNNNTNHIQQASPNDSTLQPAPNLAYARRYAASKPPYSCKLIQK